MIETEEVMVVLVTAPGIEVARQLARQVLEKRLVACVNIVPTIESHYWWKDQIESENESMMVMKTTKRLLDALEESVQTAHPYDTPEIVTFPLTAGSRKYLDWLAGEVTDL